MKTPVNELKTTIYLSRVRLLDMDYKARELAEELGVSYHYIRVDMVQKRGLPCWHDSTNHLWFNGAEVRRWIEENYVPKDRRKKSDNPMAENEFYCVKCRDRRISNSYAVVEDRGTVYKKAYCPICGTRMNKYLSKEGKK